MKQITNKEYEEWLRYKDAKAKSHILMPDTIKRASEPMWFGGISASMGLF